jgi:hypothetical protein
MNINGAVYPLLKGTLPVEVQDKIKLQPVAKWVEVLKKDPRGLAHLFNAIVHVPNWEQKEDLRTLAQLTLTQLSKARLPQDAQKIYSTATEHFTHTQQLNTPEEDDEKQSNASSTAKPAAAKSNKKPKAPKKPIGPVDGITNPNNACWLISLIQLLRTTDFFESILQENGPVRAETDEERANLIALRGALRTTVAHIRRREVVSKEELNQIRDLFYRLGEIDAFMIKKVRHYHQQDAAAVLSYLVQHLGNDYALNAMSMSRAYTFYDGNENNIQELPAQLPDPDPYLRLTVEENDSPIQALIDSCFWRQHNNVCRFVVRDRGNNNILHTYEQGEHHLEAENALIARRIPRPTEDQTRIYMQNTIFPGLHPNSYCQMVPLLFEERRLNRLPPFLEIRLNRPGASNPHIDVNIDLSEHTRVGVVGNSHYTLQSVICRPAAALNATTDKALIEQNNTSGGHYIYLFRNVVTDLWTRYNDGIVESDLSYEDVQNDLDNYAVTCFFVPQPAQQAPAQQVPQAIAVSTLQTASTTTTTSTK